MDRLQTTILTVRTAHMSALADSEEALIADTRAGLTPAQMVERKLSDVLIIHKIKNSKHKFDTSSDALVKLTKAGVKDPVIMAMMEP